VLLDYDLFELVNKKMISLIN